MPKKYFQKSYCNLHMINEMLSNCIYCLCLSIEWNGEIKNNVLCFEILFRMIKFYSSVFNLTLYDKLVYRSLVLMTCIDYFQFISNTVKFLQNEFCITNLLRLNCSDRNISSTFFNGICFGGRLWVGSSWCVV